MIYLGSSHDCEVSDKLITVSGRQLILSGRLVLSSCVVPILKLSLGILFKLFQMAKGSFLNNSLPTAVAYSVFSSCTEAHPTCTLPSMNIYFLMLLPHSLP